MALATLPRIDRLVAGPQRRAVHLTPQHRHFVAEHDDFDRHFFVVAPEEPE